MSCIFLRYAFIAVLTNFNMNGDQSVKIPEALVV